MVEYDQYEVDVAKERNEDGTVAFGKAIEPANFGGPGAISEKAERFGNDQGIIEAAILDIGLAENGQRSAFLADEEAFHGGECDGLVTRDENARHVARRI